MSIPPSSNVVLTGRILKAARALSGLSTADFASAAQVGEITIKRAEAKRGPINVSPVISSAIVSAYQRLGITFEGDDDFINIRSDNPSGATTDSD